MSLLRPLLFKSKWTWEGRLRWRRGLGIRSATAVLPPSWPWFTTFPALVSALFLSLPTPFCLPCFLLTPEQCWGSLAVWAHSMVCHLLWQFLTHAVPTEHEFQQCSSSIGFWPKLISDLAQSSVYKMVKLKTKVYSIIIQANERNKSQICTFLILHHFCSKTGKNENIFVTVFCNVLFQYTINKLRFSPHIQYTFLHRFFDLC